MPVATTSFVRFARDRDQGDAISFLLLLYGAFMDIDIPEILKAIQTANIPGILVVAGIVFILLALSGGFFKISISPSRQKWAALTGTALLVVGLVLFVLPDISEKNGGTKDFGNVFTTIEFESYSKGDGKSWTCRKPNQPAPYHFKEADRTADYIELQNTCGRHAHVRLYRDHAEYLRDTWRRSPGSNGEWK